MRVISISTKARKHEFDQKKTTKRNRKKTRSRPRKRPRKKEEERKHALYQESKTAITTKEGNGKRKLEINI